MCIQSLTGHENIIRLQHVIKAENDKDIYLTFDHMETGNMISHYYFPLTH
jgi:mitogen-activated protein kinase 15